MREIEQILGAEYIRDLGAGIHRLWKLSRECISEDGSMRYNYVITSTSYDTDGAAETYLFPSDEDGNILAWRQLPGSFQGDFDHNRAIEEFCLRNRV